LNVYFSLILTSSFFDVVALNCPFTVASFFLLLLHCTSCPFTVGEPMFYFCLLHIFLFDTCLICFCCCWHLEQLLLLVLGEVVRCCCCVDDIIIGYWDLLLFALGAVVVGDVGSCRCCC